MNFGVKPFTTTTESPLAWYLSGDSRSQDVVGRVVGAAKPATFSLFAERVRGLGDSSVLNTVQGQFSLSYAPLSLPCPYCDEVGMVTNGDELDESECWACHVEDEPECVAKERAEYAACAS